ncbi:MAG: DUF222 domain-containing protein [Acidimicrobiales bacterium]|nr:DUF222 domain-containing protein [Acidimicrobiales bacterium]
MCQQLCSLRQALAVYASQFDAPSLTPAQAGQVVGLCAQIEASAASIKALAAARSAEGNDWRLHGYRSPAEQLADRAGMSPGAAKRTLETGRRLVNQPEVAQAALAGELSLEQATAVSDGAAANPTKTAELIDKAKRSSLPELNDEVAKVKAETCDLEARRKARHAKRSFRRWTDRDGALDARLYGHPEDGALIWRMLDPIRRRLNVLRRQAGSANDPLDALDYDALVTIASIAIGKDAELTFADLVQLGMFPQCETPLPARSPESLPTGRSKKLAGSPLRVMIRVDLDTLLRGVPLEGELCEIAGYGPVPVSVIENLLATENPFIIGILTKSQALVGVYHHGRRPNAHQRSALDFLYPSCAVEGCSSRQGMQYDHRQDYAYTKITAFDLLDRFCRYHHQLKTNQDWALVEGTGKRAFVPPHDPRHPNSRQLSPARSP